MLESGIVKVLHVTLSLSRGGRRAAIASLIEGLRGFGVYSDVCCLDTFGCPAAEVAGMASRVEVLRRRSLLDRSAIVRLRGFCRERSISVIHTHDAASQFTAALASFGGPPAPLLMTFHRSLSVESATLRDRFRNAFAGVRSGAVVVGSSERRDHFLQQ